MSVIENIRKIYPEGSGKVKNLIDQIINIDPMDIVEKDMGIISEPSIGFLNACMRISSAKSQMKQSMLESKDTYMSMMYDDLKNILKDVLEMKVGLSRVMDNDGINEEYAIYYNEEYGFIAEISSFYNKINRCNFMFEVTLDQNLADTIAYDDDQSKYNSLLDILHRCSSFSIPVKSNNTNRENYNFAAISIDGRDGLLNAINGFFSTMDDKPMFTFNKTWSMWRSLYLVDYVARREIHDKYPEFSGNNLIGNDIETLRNIRLCTQEVKDIIGTSFDYRKTALESFQFINHEDKELVWKYVNQD